MVIKRPNLRGRAGALVVVSVAATVCWPGRADAQAAAGTNPHDAQPERPTLATHAHTVAPGWVELEAGFLRQPEGALSDRLTLPCVVKIGLGTRLQLDVAPGWQRDAEGGRTASGITDVQVGVKWRLADGAPVLGALAVQTMVTLPSGAAEAGRGTGSVGVSVLAISSHQFGPVSVDANAGYTRNGGNGTAVPRSSTLWTVAAGFPVAGRLGWAGEVFGYPGTTGPSGARPVVALLTGPTFTLRSSLVLDAGGIFDLAGFGGTAAYAGVTWNIGRAWRSPRAPSARPLPQTATGAPLRVSPRFNSGSPLG